MLHILLSGSFLQICRYTLVHQKTPGQSSSGRAQDSYESEFIDPVFYNTMTKERGKRERAIAPGDWMGATTRRNDFPLLLPCG